MNSEERLRQVNELLPAGFDPHQTMRVLAGYLRNLETAFEDFKKTASTEQRQLVSECRSIGKIRDDLKQEVERLTNDLIELTNTLEDQESQLATANQKVLNYEKQFKKLHRDISEMANKLTQKENDANFYRQELARSVQDGDALAASLQSANTRMEDLERKQAVEREAATMHEKESRRLNLILSESHDKIALAERKLEETVIRYSEEIKRLTDRTNTDAQHEVALLKKRIRSSAAPELRDLNQLLSAKMSAETASNFKSLFTRLLTKLEQAGLDIA